jgi:hypothetical protein
MEIARPFPIVSPGAWPAPVTMATFPSNRLSIFPPYESRKSRERKSIKAFSPSRFTPCDLRFFSPLPRAWHPIQGHLRAKTDTSAEPGFHSKKIIDLEAGIGMD